MNDQVATKSRKKPKSRADLTTVRGRDALAKKSRDEQQQTGQWPREPYWQKLATGRFLGFRPSSIGKGGTWIARYYDPDSRRKPIRALGDFGHLPANEQFGAASKAAREWFDHLSGGGAEKVLTVKEACERYAEGNKDAQRRFARAVYGDPIAKVALPKLTDKALREWRKRLAATPATIARGGKGVGRGRGKATRTRTRSAATVNRDMVPLRAALNMALDNGDVLTDRAWRVSLRPAEASGRRNLYLDRDQRRALLANLPVDAAALCRGLCLLPLRPGALAALQAGDYDARRRELAIGKDKAGRNRKILVQGETAAMLAEQAKGKLPAAPLFARWDGKAWESYMWKDAIKEAAKAAGLPDGVVAYTLRHSTITDLVQSGLDLLTVAQVSGTSVAMIEKHYGHLQRDKAAAALAGLAL
jgi:integrase